MVALTSFSQHAARMGGSSVARLANSYTVFPSERQGSLPLAVSVSVSPFLRLPVSRFSRFALTLALILPLHYTIPLSLTHFHFFLFPLLPRSLSPLLPLSLSFSLALSLSPSLSFS